MSIVADALNLTRFKVAGVLPTLAVNVSNSKYNGLMRIIDASIPNFDRNIKGQEALPPKTTTRSPTQAAAHQRRPSNVGGMRLPSNPFVTSLTQEYTIEEETLENGLESPSQPREDPQAELAKAKQKTLEFSFEVGTLQASLSKTDVSGTEVLLAMVMLEHFTLDFSLTKYEMTVDLLLRYVLKYAARTQHLTIS
jgi:vacuolar protein sorting-associated protein 13A/C